MRLRLYPERSASVAMSANRRWQGQDHRGVLRRSGPVQGGSDFPVVIKAAFFSFSFRSLVLMYEHDVSKRGTGSRDGLRGG